MAKVFRIPGGYEFVRLSLVGRRLVNEFQRHFPKLCKPAEEPDSRYVRLGSPKQNREIEKLVSEVVLRDPDSKWN